MMQCCVAGSYGTRRGGDSGLRRMRVAADTVLVQITRLYEPVALRLNMSHRLGKNCPSKPCCKMKLKYAGNNLEHEVLVCSSQGNKLWNTVSSSVSFIRHQFKMVGRLEVLGGQQIALLS